MPPPGLLGELAIYFYASARYPMAEGAILAALGLMAGVTGRAFNYEETGLNLYLLLLAESGRGKEDMDSGIERVLATVRASAPNVYEFMGPNTFASGQALIHQLGESPCFLSIQGEFGLRLKQLNDPRAPSSLTMLRQLMLDLYAKSGWGKVLRPMVYSDRSKNSKMVSAPAVTILGESTPGHVFDQLSFRDIDDGLLPRCLILECAGERPRANRNAGVPPSPGMVSRFAQLVATSLQLRENDRCVPVAHTEEAGQALQKLQDDLDFLFNDKSREAYERTLWNRVGLNIKRVAALVAVGCATAPAFQPVIEKSHVDWAVGFVSFCVESLARRFRDGMVGSGETRMEAELRKYVIEYVRMRPADRLGYNVPQKIASEGHVIPLGYFRRRAKQCTAFTQHPRGFNVALSSALATACQMGELFKLDSHAAQQRFGLRSEMYVLGDPEAYGFSAPKPAPKRFFAG